MSTMDYMGSDFNNTGSVLAKSELEDLRKKRGECVTCGQKCFKKKLFKMVPVDDVDGRVLNGRCLNCRPLQPRDVHGQSATTVTARRRTSRADLERFSRSQLNLGGSGRNLLLAMSTMTNTTSHSHNGGSAAAAATASRSPGTPRSDRDGHHAGGGAESSTQQQQPHQQQQQPSRPRRRSRRSDAPVVRTASHDSHDDSYDNSGSFNNSVNNSINTPTAPITSTPTLSSRSGHVTTGGGSASGGTNHGVRAGAASRRRGEANVTTTITIAGNNSTTRSGDDSFGSNNNNNNNTSGSRQGRRPRDREATSNTNTRTAVPTQVSAWAPPPPPRDVLLAQSISHHHNNTSTISGLTQQSMTPVQQERHRHRQQRPSSSSHNDTTAAAAAAAAVVVVSQQQQQQHQLSTSFKSQTSRRSNTSRSFSHSTTTTTDESNNASQHHHHHDNGDADNGNDFLGDGGRGSQPLPLPPPPSSSLSSSTAMSFSSPSSSSQQRRSITINNNNISNHPTLVATTTTTTAAATSTATTATARPTAKQLQHARQTLLAAQQHGLVQEGDESWVGLPQHVPLSGTGGSGTGGSGEEMLSSHLNLNPPTDGVVVGMDGADDLMDDDDDDEYDDYDDEHHGFELTLPVHGVLNRGGTFPPWSPTAPTTPSSGGSRGGAGAGAAGRSSFRSASSGGGNGGRGTPQPIVDGSSRTLSSMSSIDEGEEDYNVTRGHYLSGTMPRRGWNANGYVATSPSDYDPLEASESNVSLSVSALEQSHRDLNPAEQEYVHRIQNGGVNYEQLVLILREARESAAVVQEALAALGSLELGGADSERLAEINAPLVLVEAMHCHQDDLGVQLCGCGAIWNMSGHLANQLAFVDVGALDVIFGAMKRFSHDEDLQERAIASLSNLAAAKDNCGILLEKGIVACIYSAMEKHSGSPNVLIKGCTATTNLASHDTNDKDKMIDLGESVANAMAIHTEDALVQEKGLRAMRNLCAFSAVNKITLVEEFGAIGIAVAAMQFHREEPGVQGQGAWALANLARIDQNSVMIGESGGIDVIVRAMWVHSENQEVLEYCGKGLFVLSDSPPNRDLILELEGDTAVINAMMGHGESATLQEICCAVLTNVCQGDDATKMRLVDKEGLDATAMAMVAHQTDHRVQKRACDLLCTLAIEANFDAMMAAHAFHLVHLATQKYPEQCQVPSGSLMAAWVAQSQDLAD